MTVEIWMGGLTNPTLTVIAKRIDVSIDGVFVKITDLNGNVIETSPHNVLIIHEEKKGGE